MAAPSAAIQMRSGSSSTSAATSEGDRAEHHAGVGDLAWQSLRAQVDPGLGDERGAQDAVRRNRGAHVVEADRHQHEEPCRRQLQHDRFDADLRPALAALAAQCDPAEHRHQVERAQAEPARTTRGSVAPPPSRPVAHDPPPPSGTSRSADRPRLQTRSTREAHQQVWPSNTPSWRGVARAGG